jgi:hypothetical protein
MRPLEAFAIGAFSFLAIGAKCDKTPAPSGPPNAAVVAGAQADLNADMYARMAREEKFRQDYLTEVGRTNIVALTVGYATNAAAENQGWVARRGCTETGTNCGGYSGKVPPKPHVTTNYTQPLQEVSDHRADPRTQGIAP